MAEMILLVLRNVEVEGESYQRGEVRRLDTEQGKRLLAATSDAFMNITWGEALDLSAPPADKMMRRQVTK